MIVFIIILICWGGLTCISDKKLRLWGIIISAFFAFLAFHVNVLPESDLFRHMAEIDYYREYGFDFAFSLNRLGKNPLTAVLFWLFSFLPDNRWMPAIMTFIFYILIYNLAVNVYIDRQFSRSWLRQCLLFSFICVSFFYMVNTIRMWVVFAIFAFCFYEETIRQRKKIFCWCIYLILVFFHYAATILLICRTVVALFSGAQSVLKKVLMFVMAIVGGYLIMQTSLGTTIQEKVLNYSMYTTRGTWQTLDCWMKIIASIIIIGYGLLNNRTYKGKLVYASLCILIFFIVLVQFSNYQITLRYSDCLIILSIAMFPERVRKMHEPITVISCPQAVMLFTCLCHILYVLFFDYRYLTFNF